jgi:hypothetical protein
MNELFELIQQLVREGFYGALTIKFEAGNVVVLKKEETLKPFNLSGKPRSHNAGQKG